MSYYLRICISIALILIAFNSCQSQNSSNKNHHPIACVKINDEGITYLTNYPMNGEKGLDKAIELINEAISCDSTNVIFYNNLANAYDQKHSYDKEMIALDKVLKLTSNDPTYLMQKGMLFEVMGHLDTAKKIYKLTYLEYKKWSAKSPKDINLIKGMILLKAITDGKEEAIKTINEQIKIHPQFSTELSHELLFYQYFNRHNYVFRLPTVTNLEK